MKQGSIPIMNREDWNEFKEGKKILNGAWNIWCDDPNEKEIGYKLIGNIYYHTVAFMDYPEKQHKTITDEQWEKLEFECSLTRGDDLVNFYNYLLHLYNNKLHPQPHRIFNYKSITGIVITKCNPNHLESQHWVQRDKLENYNLLSRHQKRQPEHQWGYVNGQVVLLDVDYSDYTLHGINILKRIGKYKEI